MPNVTTYTAGITFLDDDIDDIMECLSIPQPETENLTEAAILTAKKAALTAHYKDHVYKTLAQRVAGCLSKKKMPLIAEMMQQKALDAIEVQYNTTQVPN